MTLEDIIQITRNRLAALQTARSSAYINGDLAQINAIDIEIVTTQATLDQLLTIKVS